jgi:hypothetical protein
LQPEHISMTASTPIVVPIDLRTKIAAELEQMRDKMEELGVSLCLDEAVMMRCMDQLQMLDEMGQRSTWLAELVRSDDPESRIDDITLQALADRLRS